MIVRGATKTGDGAPRTWRGRDDKARASDPGFAMLVWVNRPAPSIRQWSDPYIWFPNVGTTQPTNFIELVGDLSKQMGNHLFGSHHQEADVSHHPGATCGGRQVAHLNREELETPWQRRP